MDARAKDMVPTDDGDDQAIITLMNRAASALERAGITAQDLIDELPAAQDELLREDLGDEVVEQLYRLHGAHQQV